MKKISIVLISSLVLLVLAACGGSSANELYILNWGDYINPDVLDRFEEETGINVIYDEVGSNEEMDVRLLLGTTAYDILVPSDYMMDKWVQESLIKPLDYSKIPNYDSNSLLENARALFEGERFAEYMVPYFFGTIGIMYNTRIDGLEDAILEEGFGILFDPNSPYKIGMYDSPRDALGAAFMHLGYSVNTVNPTEINLAEALLKNANITAYGEDTLKQRVIEGNLDLALVYSGDYFDERYAHEEEGLEINFAYIAPETTNIWVDGFVISEASKNTENAYTFINFMMNEANNLENAEYVGYTPVIESVYQTILEDFELEASIFNPFPSGVTRYIYQYVSKEHLESLSEAFNRAKSN
jgi:spermidine/putrescine-binding protein